MKSEKAYNHCPACGRRIEMTRALWSNETTTFRCRGCNTRLVKKTSTMWFAAAAILSWYAIKDRFGWAGWQTWTALAALLAVMVTIALMMTRVRLATAHDPDPPPMPQGPVREGPPPLDPAFRGMSGPPQEAAPDNTSRNE